MFNEDWYSNNQALLLQKFIREVKGKDGSIIEIGCWEGKSTSYIANECYPESVICNDTWLGNVQESIVTGQLQPSEIIAKTRDVYQNFLNNMNTLTRGNYSVVKQDCIEWLKTYDGIIKFIHIDASHEYESVYETIKLVLPKLVSGGIICGDDFINSNSRRHDLHGGVERAVRELCPSFKNIDNLWYCVKD
jgi:predicted O-methyltransferase YrrM